MINRRNFLEKASLGTGFWLTNNLFSKSNVAPLKNSPIVISTWDAGINANKGAWEVLQNNGRAIDAVEKGVMVTEAEIGCCVGLGGNPDRDGIVTLDACIMDENFNCGGVAFLERIKHPISVARRVMEKTPHVLLVGSGAQQFALSEGFQLEPQELSESAKKSYEKWKQKSTYKPIKNIENTGGPNANNFDIPPEWNHDTIGMLAMDSFGNLSGSCTTSGLGFKMRGRVGDSPIIGAGLYVDNGVGACVATGQGEEVIRVAGASAVVEWMRQGLQPEQACKKVIEKIVKIKKEKAKDIQVAFLALSSKGVVGSYAINKGFSYAIQNKKTTALINANYLLK